MKQLKLKNMKKILLSLAILLSVSQSYGQTAFYKLNADSVQITKKLKLPGTTQGATTDNILTVKANGGVYYRPANTFGGGTGTVTTITSVAGNGISLNITNPTTTPQLTVVGTDLTPTTLVASGQITTGGNIRPSSSDAVSIGSTSLQYINVYSNNFLSKSGSSMNIGTAGANSFFFVSNGTQVGKIDPSSHNWIIQNGSTFTDDAINRLQVTGSVKASQYRLSAFNTAPTSATDTGTPFEVRITATFIYVCTATNTWVRTALSTW